MRPAYDADGIVIDPAHDFGKNSRHSLLLTRRTDVLVATGWPVLMAMSRKDFVGEVLDLPPDDRLEGTLAATAVAAWLGARMFRAHDVTATRRVLATVAAIRGDQTSRSVGGRSRDGRPRSGSCPSAPLLVPAVAGGSARRRRGAARRQLSTLVARARRARPDAVVVVALGSVGGRVDRRGDVGLLGIRRRARAA